MCKTDKLLTFDFLVSHVHRAHKTCDFCRNLVHKAHKLGFLALHHEADEARDVAILLGAFSLCEIARIKGVVNDSGSGFSNRYPRLTCSSNIHSKQTTGTHYTLTCTRLFDLLYD